MNDVIHEQYMINHARDDRYTINDEYTISHVLLEKNNQFSRSKYILKPYIIKYFQHNLKCFKENSSCTFSISLTAIERYIINFKLIFLNFNPLVSN